MRHWLFLMLAAALQLAGGCATTKPEEDVSSVPWNRPQTWEGAGALGGFRPPGNAGY